MFERGISRADVREVVDSGETIAEYPEDKPYPSKLLLGFSGGRPVHVVVGFEAPAGKCYVITAYIPDPAQWNEGFKTRRKP